MSWFLRFSILFTLIQLAGCSIENAKPPVNPELVIASDFLEPGDSILFNRFIKKHKCSVRILHMSTKDISTKIRMNPNNSEIDVVMLSSPINVKKLYKQKFLHNVSFEESWRKRTVEQGSEKYRYVTWGVDPIIFTYTDSVNQQLRTYSDLTRHYYVNQLNRNELIVLISFAFEEFSKVDANNWIKNSLNYIKAENDSIVGKFSKLTTLKKHLSNSTVNQKYTFPNQYSTGTMYIPYTFAIVRQAENYSIAMNFIEFYLDQTENERLNESIGTLSIHTPGKMVHFYSIDSEELMENYEIVNRILEKVNTIDNF